MVTIAGHSFDETLLTPKSKVLDLGCQGFELANWMASNIECDITCMDANQYISLPAWSMAYPKIKYYHRIVTNSDAKKLRFFILNSGNSGYSEEVHDMPAAGSYQEHVYATYKIQPYWDLVKMDIGGAEYGILDSMKEPLAKQISVTFHEHRPYAKGDEYMQKLFTHLSQWYYIHGAVKEERAPWRENYWNVLFVQK